MLSNLQGRQCTYNVTLRRVRATIGAVEKAMYIAYSECVCLALGAQHEMRIRHIFICGLSGAAMIFHIFSSMALFSGGGGGDTEHKMLVLIFFTSFV